MPGLNTLPQEILEQIVSHLPKARDLSHFSQTSQSTHSWVEREGWRAFTTNKFPSITVSPLWKDAAHALTTLSRNIDRRAFLSCDFEPQGQIYSLPGNTVQAKWHRPRGQTMGYQAVLDSYEEWVGPAWACRKSVVAWGAGAELIMNLSRSPDTVGKVNRGFSGHRDTSLAEEQQHKNATSDWLTYREQHHAEGRDDITSVNVLRPVHRQQDDDGSHLEQVVVGRANGELSTIGLKQNAEQCLLKRFDTNGLIVRSAAVSSRQSHLLASCLDDDKLVVYNLESPSDLVSPANQTTCIPQNGRSCRVWSTRFLSDTKVAVALGPSSDIVHVYDLSTSGLSKGPLRRFGHNLTFGTSAYPIQPLPNSAASGTEFDNDLLLSGGFDGAIRLHDLRSPQNFVSIFKDPIDDSAIFSLETIGRERLIAGSSNYSLLKIFDLRMTGGRAYGYQDVGDTLANKIQSETDDEYLESHGMYESGFNIFVGQNRQINSNRQRGPKESPVYSLSRPSSSSPILYVGLENSVVRFNFTSVMDAHPDPVFSSKLRFDQAKRFSPAETWLNSTPEPFAVTVYEQLGSRNIQMLYQLNPAQLSNMLYAGVFQATEPGYDERLSRMSTFKRLGVVLRR